MVGQTLNQTIEPYEKTGREDFEYRRPRGFRNVDEDEAAAARQDHGVTRKGGPFAGASITSTIRSECS